MFPSNVRKYAFLGGVSKVKFNGTVYEPDETGLITIDVSPFIVEQTTSGGSSRTMNKTWQEIHDKFLSGPVYVTMPNSYGDEDYDSIVRVTQEGEHSFAVFTANGWKWTCPIATGHPVYTY